MLLCACLSLAAALAAGKQLEKMRGEWVHVKGNPALRSGNGRQIHRHPESECQGQVLETAYQCRNGGKLFIETGFAILLTYDKGRDRITLSPGGEYERVTNPKNRKR